MESHAWLWGLVLAVYNTGAGVCGPRLLPQVCLPFPTGNLHGELLLYSILALDRGLYMRAMVALAAGRVRARS